MHVEVTLIRLEAILVDIHPALLTVQIAALPVDVVPEGQITGGFDADGQ
jgi:hypothetical protein